MTRILFGMGAALLLCSCEPTTYGKAVQAEKTVQAKAPAAEAIPSCPTVAEVGTLDYLRCERLLQQQQQGIGGSGKQDPNVKFWREGEPGMERLSEPSTP